jgi:tRNA(His) 5'-end guanylyltransferase
MKDTMKYLCENVQGVVMGYCQSDEISLLLIDYQTLNSQAFFDYEVQKICSITASMATMAFNKSFSYNVQDFGYDCCDGTIGKEVNVGREEDYHRFETVYMKKLHKAMFDSRCFNLVKEECTNYFYWRQLDATRNSIQMVGQANFSHKELQGKSCNAIQDMLHEQRGINWNDLPTYQKRGSCCIKVEETINDVVRHKWVIDNDIPIFTGDGRQYIEKLI